MIFQVRSAAYAVSVTLSEPARGCTVAERGLLRARSSLPVTKLTCTTHTR